MSGDRSLRRCTCAAAIVMIALGASVMAQGPAPVPAPLPSEALFNADVLQRIDLRVHSADWDKLKQNFQENTYYPADMVWNGQTVRNAGIRSRGFGSRSGTKPGLRVDFDRYSTAQTFLALKSVVLDNLTQDPSAIHETVAMRFFARLGVPAPREAHARLYVNNQYIGLYAVVESIDKQFLARIFGSIGDDVQNDGYLYEYNYLLGSPWRFDYLGAELDPYKQRFDAKTHENKSDSDKFGPIEKLVRQVNAVSVEQLIPVLGEHLDFPAFMRYAAAQNFVAQDDGFLGYDGMNNFYLYRLENSTRHVFLAWDEDNAFWGPEYPVAMRHDENVLMRKAMQVDESRNMYHATLREAIRSADEPTGPDGVTWLEYEVRRQSDLIDDALRDDPSKPYTFEEHQHARNRMIIFAQGRSRFVNEQLGSPDLRPLP